MTTDPNRPAGDAPTWSRRRLLLSLMALSLLCYLPAALGAGLLQFDDPFFFGPFARDAAGAWPAEAVFERGLGAVLTERIANAWLPVAHLSLYFDWSVAGAAPLLPHVHAIVLHACGAYVLARLLQRLGADRAVALAVAACFVVHPALAESVAWVSSRKVVLGALFVLLALDRVVRLAQAPRARPVDLLLAAVFAALSMLSNATSVVLPLLAGLLAWAARRGDGTLRRPPAWLAPAVLLAVCVPFALVHRQVAAAEGTLLVGSSLDRLTQAPGAFWHYLHTTLWPTQLNVLYPELDTLDAFRQRLPLGLAAMAAVLVAGVGFAWVRRTRLIGVGLFWFAIALLPFNTALPASSIAAADRYLHLAVPGMALAVVAAVACLWRRALGPVAVLLVLPLAWWCGGRAHDFRSDEQLWQASLAVEPDNAVARLNLVYDRMRQPAVALDRLLPHLDAAVAAARYPIHALRAHTLLRGFAMAQADYVDAARHARAAVAAAVAQLAQERAPSRVAEAEALLLSARLEAFEPLRLAGDEQGAEAVLAAARQADPEHPRVVAFEAIRSLQALTPELIANQQAGGAAQLDADDERVRAALERLDAAIEQHPDAGELWLAQAHWYRVCGAVTKAIRGYRRAMRLRPDDAQAYLGAARLMRERGFYEDALRHARAGFAERPDPRLLQEVALALVGQNRLDEAEGTMQAYLQLAPDDGDAKKILANLLIGRAYTLLSDIHKRAEVRQIVQQAMQLNPDDAKAHLVLGRLCHEERRYALAVEHLETARRLLPTLPDVSEHLATSLAALGFGCLLQRDEDAASDAWLRCLEVAPVSFDVAPIREQLARCWQLIEQRGVEHLRNGDRSAAIADFRRLLRIDPDQHWACWLLATAQHLEPGVDLDEQVQLLERAVAWQREHEIDCSRQVYLLARTLQQAGRDDAARRVAKRYLEAPGDEVEAEVLSALRQFAGG